MIDLHSHLLPGVDDGSRTVEQSAAVLARFAAEGVTAVALTPHLLASQAPQGVPPAHDRAYEALRAAAPDGVRLLRGAEVMLDRPLEAVVAEQRAVTLNGTRYLLVEFPRLVTNQTVEHALALVVALGLVPVVAHPERYAACRPAAVSRWRALGGLMQVDGPTLLSPRPRGGRARELVAGGLADLVAGDNHGDTRSLRPAYEAVSEQAGPAVADLLFLHNPGAVVEDARPAPVPPFQWRQSFLDRLRGLFGDHPPERT
ncbi:MAG TPA: CpsB/CapC family capsule biosynthesis tyrosine phosphatase [Gemmatimonadales bacterium]|nr:CpsB/CapC family capsule biosynthesis tyrosine phosphatase [Gemmatimonadales bacterium]